MFCSNCGNEISEDTKVCNKCGSEILPPPDENGENMMGQAFSNLKGEPYNDAISEDVQIINKSNKPLSTAAFFGTQILLMIPVINIILMLVWSFAKGTNLNRKSYARSVLIWFIILSISILFIILTLMFMGYPISSSALIRLFKSVICSIPE